MGFSSLGYAAPPLEVARLKSLSLLRTDFEPDRVKMKHESPPATCGLPHRRAQVSSGTDAYSLRNQREHGAHVRSPKICGRSIQQATVEAHDAAIRVLSTVTHIVKNGLGPRTAASWRSQLKNRPATEVTGG